MVKNLQPLVGATFHSVEVFRPEINPQEYVGFSLEDNLPNSTILSIQNRLKYLLFQTSTVTLLSHLAFTGWWIFDPNSQHFPHRFDYQPKNSSGAVNPKHVKARFHTDKGLLLYSDPRLLGKIRIFPTWEQTLNSRYLINQSPVVDSPAGELHLLNSLDKTSRRIRDVILDQSVAGGVGNYLAGEVLHRAFLSGWEPAKNLLLYQRQNLITAIREVLAEAADQKSFTWLQVFQKAGQPCGRCHSIIVREAWGRRGSYLCPVCQPRLHSTPPEVRYAGE